MSFIIICVVTALLIIKTKPIGIFSVELQNIGLFLN